MSDQGKLYHPLDRASKQIRLLQVLPNSGPSDEPICCRMQIFHLDDGPSSTETLWPIYIALSYRWAPDEFAASPKHYRSVHVNGKRLELSPNLQAFLNERFEDLASTGKWIWIDQICIEQSNIPERNHQASLMADIYRSASAVWAWLGPATADSDQAMDMVNVCLTRDDDGQDDESRAAALFETIARNSYWGRLWIIQEVLLARSITVLYGSKSASWNTLGLLLPWYESYLQRSQPWMPQDDMKHGLHAIIAYKIQAERGSQWSWKDILAVGAYATCSDVRDRAYGMLGLVVPEVTVEPDYARSVHMLY